MTIQSEAEEKKILEIIVAASEEFLQSAGKGLNYQKITDNILDISGAKYAGFDLYDEDGTKFTTVALSAPEGIIKKASSLFGFKLLGKKWDHDLVRAEKIKLHTITHFATLGDLTGDIIFKPVVSLIEKTFNIGEVIVVKILNENVTIGNFTLVMPKNARFKNENYVEIYTRQVGMLIVRSRSEAKLIESEKQLRNVFAAVSDPLFLFDQKTGDILDVNDAACSLYGYERDEMLKLKASDMSAEPKATRKSMKNFTAFVPCRHHKKKDGTVFTVEVTASLFVYYGRNVIAASMRDITERKKADDLLRTERERLANILEGTNVGTWEWNVQTGETIFNARSAGIIGYTLDEISPANIDTWERFAHPEDFKKSNDQLSKVFAREIDYQDVECRMKHKDGSWVWIQDRGKVISWTPDGKPLWMRGTYTDITERKRAEETLEENKKTIERYLDVAAEIIISIDTLGSITLLNDSGHKLLGYNHDELIGKNWFKTCLPYEMISDISSVFEKLMNGDIENVASYENIVKTKSGEIRTILWHNALLKDLDGNITGTISSGEDITDRKKTEQEIIHLSFHDHLTGLYNRRFFEEELKRLDTERQLPLSFIMGDLNGLKLINDVFGHTEGDELLKETAEILKRMCRSDDILARWGGDEFVLLLPQTLVSDTEEIVERIKKECKKTNRQKIPISLSLGTAIKETAAQDIQTIVIDAESNMYKNKLVEKESLTSSIIFALEQALYEKSNETKEHTDRIHDLAIKLGKSIKLPSSQLDELSLLASLHDIGKVAVPENILLKKAMLTEKEWKVIKRHPEIGFNIAQSSSQIAHIAKPILSCHENWDGSGYPFGISGESIPVISRIIFIIDAYDVMTGGRSYKLPMSKDDAVKELKRCAGSQFDPVLVYKFIKILARQHRI